MGLRPRTLAVSLGPEQSGGSHFSCSALIPATPPESLSLPANPLAVRRALWMWEPLFLPSTIQGHRSHLASTFLPPLSLPRPTWLCRDSSHSLRCLRSPTLAPNRCSVRIAPMHSCCSCEETQIPHPPTLPSSIWSEMRLFFSLKI